WKSSRSWVAQASAEPSAYISSSDIPTSSICCPRSWDSSCSSSLRRCCGQDGCGCAHKPHPCRPAGILSAPLCDRLALAGVIEDDLPALRPLAPDQRKDAVIFRRCSMCSAVEMELARHQCDISFAAPRAQQPNVDIAEGKFAHLIAARVAL